MRHYSYAVWIGLAINVIVAYFIISTANEYPSLSYYPYEEQSIIEVAHYLKIPTILSLAAQVIGIFLFNIRRSIAWTLVILGSLVFIPSGFIFLLGCKKTSRYIQYKWLPVYTQPSENVGETTLAMTKTDGMLRPILVSSGLGIMQFFIGFPTIGVLAIAAAIVGLAVIIPAKNKIKLGINDRDIIITPSLTSKTYAIPHENVAIEDKSDDLFMLAVNYSDRKEKFAIARSLLDTHDVEALISRLEKVVVTTPSTNLENIPA